MSDKPNAMDIVANYQPPTFMEKGLEEIIGNENAEIRRLNGIIDDMKNASKEALIAAADNIPDALCCITSQGNATKDWLRTEAERVD